VEPAFYLNSKLLPPCIC